MSPEVREESVLFIRRAVDIGVFRAVDVWHETEEECDPAIVVACGDMHQAHDRLTHCWGKLSERSQLIMANGGGLLLDSCCPVNEAMNFVPYVVAQIKGAIEAKEAKLNRRIKRIVLYFDYVCGMADKHNLMASQVCQSAVYAKRFLKEVFPDREVVLLFYLDHPADVLGSDHPLVLDHPDATAFTFNFSSDTMEDLVRQFKAERNRETQVVH
ncbi:MAG: hypothetical protein V1907_02790 [Candidatus Kerfeldbacteria bacterium]